MIPLILLLACQHPVDSGKHVETGRETGLADTDPVETGETANRDTGIKDSSDSGALDTDTGNTDTGDTGEAEVPLGGFGEITGDCGILDESVWSTSGPFLFRNQIDFGKLVFSEDQLSAGGLEVYTDGNLGGSSLYSEVFSFEVMYRCELAELIKTEGEIVYLDPDGIKTDILVEIDGRKVGTSVTRAYHYPPEDPYPLEEAVGLLQTKLTDILISAANASKKDAWERSVLHVLAWDGASADVIVEAFDELDDFTRAETILLVTVTEGEDSFIY